MTDEHRLALRLGQEIDDHLRDLEMMAAIIGRFDHVLRHCVGEAYWPLVGQQTIDLLVEGRRRCRDHQIATN